MARRNDMIDVYVELKDETETAFLFEHEWSDEPIWISKLSCEFDCSASTVTLRENLAISHGMV